MSLLIFDLGIAKSLRRGLVEQLDAEPGKLERRRFPDGETYLRVLSECAGKDTVVACSLADPDGKLLSLVFVAQTLRELGAASVGLVAPYLSYMRQDRRFHSGEAVTSRHFAQILSANFDWMVTVDPHLHRYASLDEVYSVPTRAVQAAPQIAEWLRSNVDKPVLIGPDVESEQWVSAVATQTRAPYLVLEKTRLRDDDVRVSIPQVEAYGDHTPVLIDDIISTGHTMTETLHHLSSTDLLPPCCVAVHGLFSGEAFSALRAAGAARIVTCNTVEHSSNAIDVSLSLAAAADGLVGSVAQ